MPFGLTSAPSSFQRLFNYILKPHENPFVLVYLDDVLIFSNNLEEHIDHIDRVLTLLNDNSIRLRLSKCFFARNELEHLGHMVSEQGLRPTFGLKFLWQWDVRNLSLLVWWKALTNCWGYQSVVCGNWYQRGGSDVKCVVG